MLSSDLVRRFHGLTSYRCADGGAGAAGPAGDPAVPAMPPRLPPPRLPPPPLKQYPMGLPTTPLPRTLPLSPMTATAALAGRPPDARSQLDLDGLARLLHLSAGVVRTGERDGETVLFRAAGSAGARFPLEVYVTTRAMPGVPDGVHWYDPLAHALVQVGPSPDRGVTTLIVTGVPWRTGWRYAERGYRHLYWDAGVLLAQQIALAVSAGVPARVHTDFPDDSVAALVGADGTAEFPLVLLALGDGEPSVAPAGPAVPGRIARDAVEFPLVTAMQRAGDGHRLGSPWPDPAPMAGAAPPSPALDEVIGRRGSTRLMDPTAQVPAPAFTWAVEAATRGSGNRHYVAAHGVEGLAPGLYAWPDASRPVRPGNLRADTRRVCLGQDLAGDAAFVVIAAADLDRLDARGYRAAQLAAGLTAGRLHLAAFALGLGASGMTFYDSEISQFLGEPVAGLLFTCVGVPQYRSHPGGAPGHPVRVRPPAPRHGRG